MLSRCKTLLNALLWVPLLSASVWSSAGWAEEEGISRSSIRIGGVLDLEGQSRGLGQGMKMGIERAFEGERIQGKSLTYVTLNDSYTPELTQRATQQLIDQGIFMMLGNVGTPTAKVSLPILAQHDVPAVGFFTGAGLLRPGVGDVVNYRASYIEETAAVIDQAIANGIDATEVCAYVQNDAYGMAGVEGVRIALAKQPGTRKVIQALDRLLVQEGDLPERNNIGPVGVYQRNTLTSRAGWESLKHWEREQGVRCKLVVSVGTYNAISRFAGYSRYKGDDWLVSAVSFTGADNLREVLPKFGVNDRFVMTQVVPELNSELPIVKEARRALGDNFGYVSLEGYIVGKMVVQALNSINGPLTRENFLRAITGNRFDVGGLALNFRESNQGSNLVTLTYFNGREYIAMDSSLWQQL